MRVAPMDLRLFPYSPERDVYRLLGIPPTADSDEVQAACRRLARTFHPDRNRSERATQEMQIVNAVRRALTDPQMRARYDRERWRFHAELTRAFEPASRSWEPAHLLPPPSPMTPVRRYSRAALAGLRAALASLLPPRCRRCRTVIAGDDTYCAACGTPLLAGG